MEEIRMSLEAIRAQMKKTRPEMAELLQISPDRYNRLANSETRMLATELMRLHHISGIPYECIEIPG